ncbi:prepilin-type N-terminal cleavage/methylation domain-containing protein [Thermosulfurimonas sp. F29]|uniref:prepilin-type N-terminal cleavage/methylation domain-containing protein n=1 Tax=Thermosulfurimonas sp. F29 TaxID=2867247 RepID=UPI0021083690|nr:prepilin-type N-terminal cleavage/methylation domain-containing protein [Thermosulfurimonas sp. F29]
MRKPRKDRKEAGFTLVELMIVIAIIAILAAVAISQYSAYKNKAKAKDLVGFARACAMEIVTQCEADSSFNNATQLESCNLNNGTSKYLSNITIDASSFSGCNATFTITASGDLPNGDTYQAQCTYDVNNQDISCTAPRKQ